MLIKNEYYETKCEGMTSEGNGVCRVDGFPIFVEGLIEGETAKIKITKLKKNYGFGRLIEILTTSPNRIISDCKIYKQCGGCNTRHITYEYECELKTNKVIDAVTRIGGLDAKVNPVICCENEFYYRNKVQVPFGYIDGEICYGFYKNRSHDIIQFEECLIQSEESNEVLKTIKTLFKKHNISLYDEKNHTGQVRHVLTRYSHSFQSMMIVIVSNNVQNYNLFPVLFELKELHDFVKTAVVNINTTKSNVILGKDNVTVYGNGYIQEKIDDLIFNISPNSFFQVNTKQMEVLYKFAIENSGIKDTDVVIDAYCGIGTISLYASKYAKYVYGVEIVPEAIINANENKKINNINNVEFREGLSEEIVPKLMKEHDIDYLIVDPPRKGLEKSLIDMIVKHNIKNVLYISCDPATLARDLKEFSNNGYDINYIQPVDMFPRTKHVEVVLSMVLTGIRH